VLALRRLLIPLFFCIAINGSYSQTRSTASIQDCANKSGFAEYLSALQANKKLDADYGTKTTKAHRACLSSEADIKDPVVLTARGMMNSGLIGPDQEGQENLKQSVLDFCAAADMGYLPAQEHCAMFIIYIDENPKTQYEHYKKAAWMGSSLALGSLTLSPHTILESTRLSRDQTLFTAQYLQCHPSMLVQPQCLSETDPKLHEFCKKVKNSYRQTMLKNLKACQSENDSWVRTKCGSSGLSDFILNADKQLEITLASIKEQIKRFPNLAEYSYEISEIR
jgi:hypothetical protein